MLVRNSAPFHHHSTQLHYSKVYQQILFQCSMHLKSLLAPKVELDGQGLKTSQIWEVGSASSVPRQRWLECRTVPCYRKGPHPHFERWEDASALQCHWNGVKRPGEHHGRTVPLCILATSTAKKGKKNIRANPANQPYCPTHTACHCIHLTDGELVC